jgi:hypothetical protein
MAASLTVAIGLRLALARRASCSICLEGRLSTLVSQSNWFAAAPAQVGDELGHLVFHRSDRVLEPLRSPANLDVGEFFYVRAATLPDLVSHTLLKGSQKIVTSALNGRGGSGGCQVGSHGYEKNGDVVAAAVAIGCGDQGFTCSGEGLGRGRLGNGG